jgi:hypothetical protein
MHGMLGQPNCHTRQTPMHSAVAGILGPTAAPCWCCPWPPLLLLLAGGCPARTLKLFLCEESRDALTLLKKPPLYSRDAVTRRPCIQTAYAANAADAASTRISRTQPAAVGTGNEV